MPTEEGSQEECETTLVGTSTDNDNNKNSETTIYGSFKTSSNTRRDQALKAVKESQGNALENLSPTFQNDKEIVLEAVFQNGGALQWASESLKNDKEVVLVAINNSYGEALKYASMTLQEDKEVAIATVTQNPYCFWDLQEKFQHDRDVVMGAVKADVVDGDVLELVPEEYLSDREIILAAVKGNGQAIGWSKLRGDREVALAAIKSKCGKTALFDHVDQSLKEDKDFVLSALKEGLDFVLPWASDKVQQDVDVSYVASEFQMKKQKLTHLYVHCECQRQMHRLARSYYAFRDTWFSFCPVLVVTLISAILAFTGASDAYTQRTKGFILMLIGVSSIVSVFGQICGKKVSYAAKSKFHENVALKMKILSDSLNFDQIDPESGFKVCDHGNNDVLTVPFASLGEGSINDFKTVYNLITKASYDSMIPSPIQDTFSIVDTKLADMLNTEGASEILNNNLHWVESMDHRSILAAMTYNNVYAIYISSWSWPWLLHNSEILATKAIDKVEKRYILTRGLNFCYAKRSGAYVTENFPALRPGFTLK